MQAIELLLKNPRTLTADELLEIKTASINNNIFLDIVSDLVSAVDKLEFAKLSSADPVEVDNQYASLVKIASKLVDFIDVYEVMFPEAVEALVLGMEKSAGFGKFMTETLGKTIRGMGRITKHPISYHTMAKKYLDNKGYTNFFARARALGEGNGQVFKSFVKDLKTTKHRVKDLKKKEKTLKKIHKQVEKQKGYNDLFDAYRSDAEKAAIPHLDPDKVKQRLKDIRDKRIHIETEAHRGSPYSVAKKRYVEYKKTMQQKASKNMQQKASKKITKQVKNLKKNKAVTSAAAAATGAVATNAAVNSVTSSKKKNNNNTYTIKLPVNLGKN